MRIRRMSGFWIQRTGSRRGAMLVLIAAMMVVLLVMVAFCIDIAYMQLVRTQLRAATDAATRAGGEALSRTQDTAAALAAAKAAAAKNLVAGSPLVLADEDVHFGRSETDANGVFTFSATEQPINSLEVHGRRTSDSLSGSVPLFFGRVLGVSTFEPVYTSRSVNLDRDVCLVVDRSGSMCYTLTGTSRPAGLGECDPPHATLSRWSALRVAVDAFIDGVAETPQLEHLALVTYASEGSWCGNNYNASDIEQPLSEDYTTVSGSMTALSNGAIVGRTNIAAGIDNGVVVLTDPILARPFAEKTMVLLTDGLFNEGREPHLAAADAAACKIVIHTVTFSDGADQAEMQLVAEATGGNHYHAPDAATLEAIFSEIARTLPVVLTH